MWGVSFIGKLPQSGSSIEDFHATSSINFDAVSASESRQATIIVSLDMVVQWGIHPTVSIPNSRWCGSFGDTGKFVFNVFEDLADLLLNLEVFTIKK